LKISYHPGRPQSGQVASYYMWELQPNDHLCCFCTKIRYFGVTRARLQFGAMIFRSI
jgi:hypothetical protein